MDKYTARLCQTCHWWGLENEDRAIAGIPGGDVHKPCEHPKVGGGSYSSDARMGADALNSYESVGTGPDFGCIHWQAAKVSSS